MAIPGGSYQFVVENIADSDVASQEVATNATEKAVELKGLHKATQNIRYGHRLSFLGSYCEHANAQWFCQTLPLSSRLYYYRARRFIFSRGKNVGSASLHSTVGQFLLEYHYLCTTTSHSEKIPI